jgi:hypothetical protein
MMRFLLALAGILVVPLLGLTPALALDGLGSLFMAWRGPAAYEVDPSGCTRMTNVDVEVFYERVKVGTRVVVL